jgi:hypothetical protein
LSGIPPLEALPSEHRLDPLEPSTFEWMLSDSSWFKGRHPPVVLLLAAVADRAEGTCEWHRETELTMANLVINDHAHCRQQTPAKSVG